MISRFRIVVALLAFLAFGFAAAEPLWASTSAKAAVGGAACMDLMSGGCEQESHGSRAPTLPCPSMPAGMASTCSALVAALAESLPDLPLIAVDHSLPSASFDAPVLLLASGLFHPPRA